MSDQLAPPQFTYVKDGGSPFLQSAFAIIKDLVEGLVEKHHEGLEGARFAFLLVHDRPDTWWGRIKLASEEIWHLTGGEDDGVNLILHLNSSLWSRLHAEARLGLLDLLLAQVERKKSGKTDQSFPGGGERPLYQKVNTTFGLDVAVLARNPAFVEAVEELRNLKKSLAEPKQMLLDLANAATAANGYVRGDGDEDGDGDGDGGEVELGGEGVLAETAHGAEA